MIIKRPRTWHLLLWSLGSTFVQAENTLEQSRDATDAEVPTSLPTTEQAMVYSIYLNQRFVESGVLIRLDPHTMLVEGNALKRWNVVVPAEAKRQLGNLSYFSLADIPGAEWVADSGRQIINITIPSQRFLGSTTSLNRLQPTQANLSEGNGLYVNYDLNFNHTEGGKQTFAGQVEPVLFGNWGSLNSRWLATSGNGNKRWLRFDSQYRYDWPNMQNSLEIGDSLTSSGTLARPVRLGGLRFSKNFSLQPGYLTVPQPRLEGEVAVPSILDLYLDGVRTETRRIPAGPFSLENIPTLTGNGEIELLVRDALGREQIIRESYIVAPRQLRTGLTEYSFELGQLRRDFGSRSGSYSGTVALANYRRGWNEYLTLESHGEWLSSSTQVLGLASTVALPNIGIFLVGVQGSQSDLGTGHQYHLGFERNQRRGYSFGMRWSGNSKHYQQVHLNPGERAVREQKSAFVGLPLVGFARLNLNYLSLLPRTVQPPTEIVTASLNTQYRQASLSLQVIHRIQPSENRSYALNIAFPWGSRNTASAGYRYNEGSADPDAQFFARVQKGIPQGLGWGYRAGVSRSLSGGNNQASDVGVFYNGNLGGYGLETRQLSNSRFVRAEANGSLGYFAGLPWAARRINSAFALVKTNIEDLPVQLYSQTTTTTNPRGFAIAPNLQAYQANRLQFDLDQLPLDVQISSKQMTVTPYFRHGLVVDLPTQKSQSTELQAYLTPDQPVPRGALGKRVGDEAVFPVDHGGRMLVTGLPLGTSVLEIRWSNRICTLQIDLPTAVPPDLGKQICRVTE